MQNKKELAGREVTLTQHLEFKTICIIIIDDIYVNVGVYIIFTKLLFNFVWNFNLNSGYFPKVNLGASFLHKKLKLRNYALK